MFPIPWNFPLRKKNGKLVNIGDAIDEGTGIPEHGEGDAGKVLSVDENGDLEWADAPTEIPDFDSSDEGKLLSVDENGELEWSDTVNSEIQTLTNKLEDEVSARAELGAHNLVDINGFTLIKSSARTKYIYPSNIIHGAIPSEQVVISFKVTNSNLSKSDNYFKAYDSNGEIGSVSFKANGRYSFVFDGASFNSFYIFISSNAESDETCTISEIMIKLATDAYSEYVPYAMTNSELTENVLSTISTKFIKIITAELSDSYNPITIADELVATGSSEIVYVQVGGNTNITNPELYCPLSYTIYEIRHTGDTITINAVAYNQDISNLIYTIGRSRNSNWGTWNKTLRATLVSDNLTKVESNIAWFAGYDAKVYKQGKIAEISIRAAASGQIMPNTSLFTIPSGFLPNRAGMQLSGYVDMMTAGMSVPCRVYVDNGNIKLNVGMDAGDNLYISGMYFIAD